MLHKHRLQVQVAWWWSSVNRNYKMLRFVIGTVFLMCLLLQASCEVYNYLPVCDMQI